MDSLEINGHRVEDRSPGVENKLKRFGYQLNCCVKRVQPKNRSQWGEAGLIAPRACRQRGSGPPLATGACQMSQIHPEMCRTDYTTGPREITCPPGVAQTWLIDDFRDSNSSCQVSPGITWTCYSTDQEAREGCADWLAGRLLLTAKTSPGTWLASSDTARLQMRRSWGSKRLLSTERPAERRG